jgi:hypothetical protein
MEAIIMTRRELTFVVFALVATAVGATAAQDRPMGPTLKDLVVMSSPTAPPSADALRAAAAARTLEAMRAGQDQRLFWSADPLLYDTGAQTSDILLSTRTPPLSVRPSDVLLDEAALIEAAATRSAVEERVLADTSFDPTGVRVEVSPVTRIITLRGIIPSESGKRAAEQVARLHARGYTVVNQLLVFSIPGR